MASITSAGSWKITTILGMKDCNGLIFSLGRGLLACQVVAPPEASVTTNPVGLAAQVHIMPCAGVYWGSFIGQVGV